MTLIGLWIERDRGFIWSDSESYDEKKPSGHFLKLAINERTMVASVGAGQLSTVSAMKMAVAQAANFDELIDGFPAHLKMHAEYWDAANDWCCAAVGWSRRFARLIAAVFRRRFDFAPTFTSGAFALPHLGHLENLYPSDASDIFSFARLQMTEVQRQVPLAGDGLVTVATISRSTIETVYFDLATGRRNAGMPDGVGGVETIDRATQIRRAEIPQMGDFLEVCDASSSWVEASSPPAAARSKLPPAGILRTGAKPDG